jgi:hypothetical protein
MVSSLAITLNFLALHSQTGKQTPQKITQKNQQKAEMGSILGLG